MAFGRPRLRRPGWHRFHIIQPADYYQGAWDRTTVIIGTSGAVSCALIVVLALLTLRQITDLQGSRAR